MSSLTTDICSLSILLGGIIGLARFKEMDPRYHPFLFLLWIGCINEILSFILVRMGYYTIITSNLYILMEALLLTWYFQKMHLFDRYPLLFRFLLLSLAVCWAGENLLFHPLRHYSIYFRIFYSTLMVLLSIVAINQLLLTENRSVGRNAGFILCGAFIFYFLIKVLVNAFWLYGLASSRQFLLQVSRILVFVNLITNLVYALALVWIPKKQPCLLPSSFQQES
ncbi:MAG: hypothetical protein ACXVBR_03490 [Flavisolibacter sp.]